MFTCRLANARQVHIGDVTNGNNERKVTLKAILELANAVQNLWDTNATVTLVISNR